MKTVNLNSKLRSKASILKAAAALGFTDVEIVLADEYRCFKATNGTKWIARLRYTFEGERKGFYSIKSKGVDTVEKSTNLEITKEVYDSLQAEKSTWDAALVYAKKHLENVDRVYMFGSVNNTTYSMSVYHNEEIRIQRTDQGDRGTIEITDDLYIKLWNKIRTVYAKKVAREQELDCTCGKCNGTGYIAAFAWYADGVCFDCIGSGIRINNSIVNVEV